MNKITALFSTLTLACLLGAATAQAGNADRGHDVPVAPAEYLAKTNPIKADDKRAVKKGKRIYKSKCKKCHGADGGGDGPNAEFLVIKPVAFSEAGYLATRKDGQLFWIIQNGSPGTDMLAHGKGTRFNLYDEEIWKVIAHMRKAFTR